MPSDPSGFWAAGSHDVRTYEAAFVETYARVWDEIGLPPFQGEITSGPQELMLRALDRVLGDDDAVWAEKIADKIRWSADADDEIDAVIDATASETGLPSDVVASVLGAARRGEVDREAPPEVRTRILRQGYLALW